MKKYTYPEALREAVEKEYNHRASDALRQHILHIMRLPVVKPWYFVGAIALLLASPLTFYLVGDKLIYSANMLLALNIATGVAVFFLIFAGVAHRFADPKQKTLFLERLAALRTGVQKNLG